jgi:hypothetical protein
MTAPVFLALIGAILAAWVPTGPALAAEAHVHGEASLAVAVDGGTLTLLLEAPTDSLVGFEHAPRNDGERAAIARMKVALERFDALFRPSAAADCRPAGVTLESELLEEGHDHAAGHEHGEHAGHADLEGEFVFECGRPEALRDLEVRLFEHFTRLEHLAVQVAGPRGQTSARLDARRNRVSW